MQRTVKNLPRTMQIAMDDAGPGGASHVYEIRTRENNAILGNVQFQKGPLKEAGINGVMDEDLICILIDRLEGFQAGPYKHTCNGEAAKHLKLALAQLNRRTSERRARGVEGTHEV